MRRITLYLIERIQLLPFLTITSAKGIIIKKEKNVQNQTVFNKRFFGPQSEKISIL